jgi:hypothetical protein
MKTQASDSHENDGRGEAKQGHKGAGEIEETGRKAVKDGKKEKEKQHGTKVKKTGAKGKYRDLVKPEGKDDPFLSLKASLAQSLFIIQF